LSDENTPSRFQPGQEFNNVLAYCYQRVMDASKDGLSKKDEGMVRILWAMIADEDKTRYSGAWDEAIEKYASKEDEPQNIKNEKFRDGIIAKLQIVTNVVRSNGWLYQVKRSTDYDEIIRFSQELKNREALEE